MKNAVTSPLAVAYPLPSYAAPRDLRTGLTHLCQSAHACLLLGIAATLLLTAAPAPAPALTTPTPTATPRLRVTARLSQVSGHSVIACTVKDGSGQAVPSQTVSVQKAAATTGPFAAWMSKKTNSNGQALFPYAQPKRTWCVRCSRRAPTVSAIKTIKGKSPTPTPTATPNPTATATATPRPTVTPTATPGAQVEMKFQDFNGTTVLRNGDGDTYPMIDSGTVSLDPSDSISGNSLRVNLTNPAADHDIQIQFNPYNYAGTPGFPQAERAFARDYSANPAAWQFNTYNRFSFWFQRPTSVSPLDPGGNFYDVQIGTYVKQVTNADSRSDEIGGNHYYHLIGVPNFGAGTWTHVILNMHPDHVRSENRDPGFVQYPTAVGGPNGGDDPPSTYNYFDTLTRFYIDDLTAASPCTFRVDDFTFYKEPDQENDQQVLRADFDLHAGEQPTAHHLEA